MAKKITGYIKLQLPLAKYPALRWFGPRPAWCEHHEFVKAVQREVRRFG